MLFSGSSENEISSTNFIPQVVHLFTKSGYDDAIPVTL